MNPCKSKAPPGMTAGLRFILLGWAILLLFATDTPGQSGWPPPFKTPFIPAKSHQEAALREDIFQTSPSVSPRHLVPSPPFSQAASGSSQNLSGPPPAGAPDRPWCPLPPTSAFSLQTNLRKFLETWPTPGATESEEWPEYTGESEQDLD